ncbi:probable serine hydrolase [Eupeodes corollae]|uniref:probable serine hydrolase n=1 Tax=Eupeodes corollae TaxID=290404 RepID=UPI0024929ED9|nr:probable serine hydrolase [Eupeodes corollae]
MDFEIDFTQENSREFEEIIIPVPWGHIAGRWYGEKNVRPILALHGWLDNYGTWDNLIPLMPPHIGVLAIDMAGHGKSSRRPQGEVYHGFSYLADIIRVMDQYNWDKVSIMAHSMSSVIAFVFAALYPYRIDMLIQLDSLHPRINSPAHSIWQLNYSIEKFMLEERRIRESDFREPPSYTYDELVGRVHEGSNRSVDVDKCKHLIRTNVSKSKLYPSKYYFSRDPRVKYYLGFCFDDNFIIAMAKRIKIPQLVIKASESHTIDENNPVIEVLRKSNPYFEFHTLQGTHHVHLNNAPETSILVNTFVHKWRPNSGAAAVVNVDGAKPQLQICPTKPQGLNSKL